MLAQEEARAAKQDAIGTEHLLLVIVHEGQGIGARTLEALDVSPGPLRAAIERLAPPGRRAPDAQVPFTPAARKALELGLREALQLGHRYVGSEHILLGVVREQKGVGARALTEFGVDLARARHEIVELVGNREEAPDVSRLHRTATLSAPAPRSGVVLPSPGACSFCGRERAQLGRPAIAAGALICAECVERARAAFEGGGEAEVVLPTLVEGQPPETTAVEEVVAAFGSVYGGGSPEAREAALEDGSVVAHLAEEARARFPGVAAALALQRISFRAADEADVFFSVAGLPFAGRALRVGGRWKVSRETWCQTLARAGIECPPAGQ